MVILRKSIYASSYGGIIRIRLRVEGHTFLSACLSKLPCVRKYSTTVDICQFKEKHLINNLIKIKRKKTNSSHHLRMNEAFAKRAAARVHRALTKGIGDFSPTSCAVAITGHCLPVALRWIFSSYSRFVFLAFFYLQSISLCFFTICFSRQLFKEAPDTCRNFTLKIAEYLHP